MSNFSPRPIFHDLSSYSQEDLDLIGVAVWEIPVPIPDVLWTIVLAYCCSTASDAVLTRRLTKIGAEKVGKKIKQSIKYYNPFLHRNTCFHDEKLNALVEVFRKQTRKICNAEDKLQNVIRAASDLLSCKIIVLWDNWKIKCNDIEVFPNRDCQMFHDGIFIFSSLQNVKKSEESERSFSFGMLQEFALPKRKSALKCILENVDLKQDDCSIIISRIFNSPINNFPLFVSKNSQSECITEIYKSEYSLAKLQDAAFETDPQQEDEHGKSALYYSLLTKDSEQFYILHEYAANVGGSLRTPDSTSIKNLHQLKKHLEKLHNQVESECMPFETKEECRKKLKEICRFNEFLIMVCKNCFELNSVFAKSRRSIIDETKLRKDIILSILCSYNAFFGGFGFNDLENEGFAEYLKYRNYFDKLDLFVALLFFDNLFLLKERISLHEKYLKVESQFHSFFYFKSSFEKYNFENVSSQLFYIRVIFQMRLLLQKELNYFAEHLKGINIDEVEVNKCLLRSEVETLTNSSAMHDEFIVYKIKCYLDAATEVKVKDIKSVLIIEKCLHVLGECFKATEEFDSIKKVLAFALSKELVMCLTKFRNKIIHKDKISATRISAEKDIELFERIQLELKKIKEILKPIFCAQTFWTERYYHQVVLNTVRQLQEMKLKEKDILQIMDFLSLPADKNSFKRFEEFEVTSKKDFNDFFHSFRNKYRHVCYDQGIKTNSKYEIYKCLFSNIFAGTDKQIKIFEYQGIQVNILQDYFWSMDYLLHHIIGNEPREHIRKQFSKILEKKTDLFLNLNSDEYSESLVREVKQVLLEYEIITTKILANHGSTPISIQNDFKNIQQLSCTVFLNTREQKMINDSIPRRFKTVHISKALITLILNNQQTPLPNQQQILLQKHLQDLPLKPSDKKFILKNESIDPKKCVQKIKQVKDYYGMLRKATDKCELSFREYGLLCEKLEIPEYSKDVLGKIVKEQNQNAQVNKLEFLRIRIKYLKEILVDGNKDIKLLWKISKSQKSFLYIQERVIQTYLNDPEVQVSVEMLLFDCMNIMKPDKKEMLDMEPKVVQHLVYLWRKSNNLLKGMCLRNVLAHGDPLLESMGFLLDKEDLPRELVTRMLQFVKDGATMDHMLEVQSIIGTNPKDFASFMNATNTDIGKNLLKIREKIKRCPRWKDYASFVSSELF